MSLRFKDEPDGARFRALLNIGVDRRLVMHLSNIDAATRVKNAELFEELRAAEWPPTVESIDERVRTFRLDSNVLESMLRHSNSPFDLVKADRPFRVAIEGASGEPWFWSDSADFSCGVDVGPNDWASAVFAYPELRSVRMGARWSNLYNAGGAEELIGDLAMPSLAPGSEPDFDVLRRELLVKESHGVVVSLVDDVGLLRSLGASALVLDTRANVLGNLVWKRAGVRRERLTFSAAEMHEAAALLNEILLSARWPLVWPESADRISVEQEMRQLLA